MESTKEEADGHRFKQSNLTLIMKDLKMSLE